MDQPVAVPKIFLRGNRWYVRVQVPAAMQPTLKRVEYWVSLRTSDRSVALDRALEATSNKRQEIELAFHELVEGDHSQTSDGDADRQSAFGGDEDHPIKTSPVPAETSDIGIAANTEPAQVAELDVAQGDKPPKARRYDHLSKQQLIALLEHNDRTKKLGLVWERDGSGCVDDGNNDFMAARIDRDLCDGPAPWTNMVIEGDNYDALRWLRTTHRARVKCIYIDPPYNTGNSGWVYHDRYHGVDDRYRQSAWLEFLHRRLVLARHLLTEDGVILMSINDEQRALAE